MCKLAQPYTCSAALHRNLQVFERGSESDTDSTVSIGEDADRHIEAPFAAEYNGLLGRLVRACCWQILSVSSWGSALKCSWCLLHMFSWETMPGWLTIRASLASAVGLHLCLRVKSIRHVQRT